MPPKPTFRVDPNQALLAVYRAVQADVERLKAEWKTIQARRPRCTPADNRYIGGVRIDLESAKAGWTPYDIPRLAGGVDLSESQKQAWRRVLRNDLMKRELIDIFMRRIQITATGREAAKALIEAEQKGKRTCPS